MATNYPGALDSAFSTHQDALDSVVAVETELGTNPSGNEATVKQRLDRIGVIDTTSSDVTVVNTTTPTALANFTVPSGITVAGDLFILEAGGDYLNNSGAGVNLTFRVVIGTTTLTSVAQSITASGTRRKWTSRVAVSAASLSAQDADLQAALSGATGNSFNGLSFSWWGHDVAAESLSGSWAFKLESVHGTAASTIDIVCKYARLTRVPKVTP